MTDQLSHLVGRQHLCLHVEGILKPVVVDPRVSRGKDEHAAFRRFEGERLGNARALHADGLCRKFNGCGGNLKLQYAIFHAERAKIGTALFDGH